MWCCIGWIGHKAFATIGEAFVWFRGKLNQRRFDRRANNIDQNIFRCNIFQLAPFVSYSSWILKILDCWQIECIEIDHLLAPLEFPTHKSNAGVLDCVILNHSQCLVVFLAFLKFLPMRHIVEKISYCHSCSLSPCLRHWLQLYWLSVLIGLHKGCWEFGSAANNLQASNNGHTCKSLTTKSKAR